MLSPFVLAVLTACIWGCVPMIEKIGLARVDPLVGLFYRSFGVVFGIIPLFFIKADVIKQSFSNLHSGMLYLVLGGFMASILGQIFFYHALKTGEISKVVPISGAYPLVSFILGLVLLGEQFTATKAIGVIFVLCGVMFLK